MPLPEVKCPHCFREVFVNMDDKCPACRNNVNEKDDGLDDLKPMEFVDGEPLPPVCVVCGEPARYTVPVGEKNDVERTSAAGALARILAAFFGVISIPIKPKPFVKEYKICVQFPVCEKHMESKVLRPLDVDYRRYRLTVPVHPRFIERWKTPQG